MGWLPPQVEILLEEHLNHHKYVFFFLKLGAKPKDTRKSSRRVVRSEEVHASIKK